MQAARVKSRVSKESTGRRKRDWNGLYYGWGQSPDQMHNFYHIADLVIVPSQVEEAFCMVAVEAMAAGKAVLASKKGD